MYFLQSNYQAIQLYLPRSLPFSHNQEALQELSEELRMDEEHELNEEVDMSLNSVCQTKREVQGGGEEWSEGGEGKEDYRRVQRRGRVRSQPPALVAPPLEPPQISGQFFSLIVMRTFNCMQGFLRPIMLLQITEPV